MTQALVTRQQVFDTAEKLKQAGKPVTGYATYDVLRVGSLNTHYKYVNEWLKLQGVTPSNTPERTSIPEVIANITDDLNSRLAKVIEAEVQIRVDGQATVYRTDAAESNQKFDSVLADSERILTDLNEERRCRSELQSAYDAAIQRVADLTMQAANAAARTETAELREREVRKHVDDLKAELAALLNLHKAEQEQSSQLRLEITRMQARLEQATEDTATVRAEVAAVRTAADAFAAVDAAKASAEIEALTVARDEARRDAKEQTAMAARLGGELEAVRRQADDYHAIISKRKAGRATPAARGSKSHAN
ncbi:MAG: DNA-binding protein [Burkholderiales bacterium]